MSYNGTPWSKTQYYRRLKKSNALGCSIYDVPDARGKHGNHSKSVDHHKWNNDRITSTEGYTKVRVGVGHPLADPNGYAYEHILVWVSAGNQRPQKGEIVHHVNENKDDNRIENLKLMTRSVHNAHHNEDKQRDECGKFVGREWNEYPEPKQ